MKKIVVLSDHDAGLYSRVKWINSLFPECEIEFRMVTPINDVLEFDSFGVSAEIPRTKEITRCGVPVPDT